MPKESSKNSSGESTSDRLGDRSQDRSIDPAMIPPEIVERMESVRVEPDPPGDFEQFWRATVDELDAIPINLEIEPCEPPGGATDVECAVWRADSLGGRRIGGLLAVPRSGAIGQWVYGHGYGSVTSGVGWRIDIARAGFAAVGVDARGYNRSRLPGDPVVPGWILHGIEDRSTYILRGAVADTVRAVQVARSLPGADPRRTVLYGKSFSGGLAVMAAPWIDDLRYVAVGVPTFGAYDLRRRLVERGSGAEINGLFATLDPDGARALRERLRYFDCVNFAPLIRSVDVTVGYGVVDPVVPGETVAAIYHAVGSERKELLSFPCSHSTHPLAAEWSRFEAHVLERARTLVDGA